MTKGIKKVFVTGLTDIMTTDVEGVGTIRFEGNQVYKWMEIKNTTATVAGAAGDPVCYEAEDGHTNHRAVLDITDADAVPSMAGCICGTITGTAGTSYYGWVRIKGSTTLTVAIAASVDGTPVACADGDQLVFGAADKTLRRVNTVIDADTEARAIVGRAMDASAKTIIVDCPF